MFKYIGQNTMFFLSYKTISDLGIAVLENRSKKKYIYTYICESFVIHNKLQSSEYERTYVISFV